MRDFIFVLKSWLTWRVILFIIAYIAIFALPAFGARFPYYDRVLEITKLPNWIWGFGNFDGVHYLRIAQDGYKAQFSQAFFPLFPLIIRLFSYIFPRIQNLDTNIYTDPAFFSSGIILSNLFLPSALLILYKLLKLDFDEKISKWSVIFLLIFPTSFYFGAVYTESLFLLLSVSAIYLIRRKKYFYSALIIALASATRLTGILLMIIFIAEVLKNRERKRLIYVILMPIGLLTYMYYLKTAFNNPFYFLTSQPVFGAERLTGGLVLLPQVLYRYIKIFLTTQVSSLAFFNAFLEFSFTLVFLAVLLLYLKKMRPGYLLFSFAILLLPSLTGTLSSMPRYVLGFAFLLIPYLLRDYKKYIRIAIIPLVLLGFILVGLFVRGYWVA